MCWAKRCKGGRYPWRCSCPCRPLRSPPRGAYRPSGRSRRPWRPQCTILEDESVGQGRDDDCYCCRRVPETALRTFSEMVAAVLYLVRLFVGSAWPVVPRNSRSEGSSRVGVGEGVVYSGVSVTCSSVGACDWADTYQQASPQWWSPFWLMCLSGITGSNALVKRRRVLGFRTIMTVKVGCAGAFARLQFSTLDPLVCVL